MRATPILSLMVLMAAFLEAQTTPTPVDCQFSATFTASSLVTPSYYNKGPTAPCIAWRLTYATVNATGVSISLQGTNNLPNGTADPAGWTNLTVTAPVVNPATGVNAGTIAACCDYYPWVRAIAGTFTGTGQTMSLTVLGYKGTSASRNTGGGSGTVTAVTATSPIVSSGSTTPVISLDTTKVPQKFFGTAAPGSVATNLPGDLFTDTTAHNEYVCGAPSGTAAPACTTVSAGGWLLTSTGGTVTAVTATSPIVSSNGTTPAISLDTTKVPQKFFGTAAPGSVATNLPGDLFTDTTAHNEYVCGAPSGTAAPACTTVSAGGWLQVNGGGGGTGNVIGPASSTAGHLATFADATGELIQDGGAPAVPFGSCNFTPTITLGSVYQNTGTQTLWVTTSWTLTSVAGGEIGALVGNANPPTHYVAEVSHPNDGYGQVMQLSVMVPPSYYFKFLLEIGAAVQSDKTTCTSSGTAGGGGTPPTTQVNVGASRALDGTVYQNIGSTPMWVSVSGRCATGGNGDFYAMTNSTNSLVNPTNITAIQADIGLGNWGSLTFVVLPSWYYSVTQEACTPDATRFWTEWQ